jgi:hypothetical protein
MGGVYGKRMCKREMHAEFSFGNLKEKDTFEDLNVDERNI